MYVTLLSLPVLTALFLHSYLTHTTSVGRLDDGFMTIVSSLVKGAIAWMPVALVLFLGRALVPLSYLPSQMYLHVAVIEFALPVLLLSLLAIPGMQPVLKGEATHLSIYLAYYAAGYLSVELIVTAVGSGPNPEPLYALLRPVLSMWVVLAFSQAFPVFWIGSLQRRLLVAGGTLAWAFVAALVVLPFAGSRWFLTHVLVLLLTLAFLTLVALLQHSVLGVTNELSELLNRHVLKGRLQTGLAIRETTSLVGRVYRSSSQDS